MAGILDELSSCFFAYECNLLNLSRNDWKEQMEQFKPQLLFVESAWKGKNEEWYQKVCKPSEELKDVLEWCHKNQVPTVFWNKEDPVHFTTFLQTAFLFDWVFTTDMDCIPLYKRLLNHNQVGLLPFAASMHLFHPIEQYERKAAVSFAGSYYRLQKERTNDFTQIYEACHDVIPFEIYDRNPYSGNEDYMYPNEYQQAIQGTLPIDQMDRAYKNYLFSLTMNTVKNSSTMEARRVFELLASNTVAISNECKGITNFFGDLVLIYQNKHQFEQQFSSLIKEKEQYNKLRLLGLRKVLREHTYEQRLHLIAQKVLHQDTMETPKTVLIFSEVKSQEEAEQIYEMFEHQTYEMKELILIANRSIRTKRWIKVIHPNQIHVISDIGKADYYAYFSAKNYYGPNFILDCILTKEYGRYPVIGKGSYYKKTEDGIELQYEQQKYQIGNQVKFDRCIINQDVASTKVFSHLQRINIISGYQMMLIDEFNFCEHYQGQHCEKVDDLKIPMGYTINDIYKRAEQLESDSYVSIQKVLTGTEVIESIDTKNYTQIIKSDGETNLATIENKYKMDKSFYLYSTISFDVREYCSKNQLNVYLRGTSNGNVKFTIDYRDKNGNDIKRFYVPVNACVILPVPNGAKTFCINPILGGGSSLCIEEVCFNPNFSQGIPIEKPMDEKERNV